MRPYSIDLRQKIVEAVDRGGSTLDEIAENFGVGMTFLKKLLRRRRETSSIEPLPQRHGPAPSIDFEKEVLIGNYVLEHPDATLEELCEYL
jgi:transposase